MSPLVAQNKEDKSILIKKAEKELDINPEKAEEIAQYLLQNYNFQNATYILTLAQFNQNKLAPVLESIATKTDSEAEEKAIYFSLLFRLNIKPTNLFVTADSYYIDFWKLQQAIEHGHQEETLLLLQQLQRQTTPDNRFVLSQYWISTLTLLLENEVDLALQNEMRAILTQYDDTVRFQLLAIQLLLKYKKIDEAIQQFAKLPLSALQNTKNLDLKNLFLKIAIEISELKKNGTDFIKNQREQLDLQMTIQSSITTSRSLWFSILEKHNQNEITSLKRYTYWILGFLVFSLLFIVFILILYKYKNKAFIVPLVDEKKLNSTTLSEKTENFLLEKLDKFEKSELYLNNKISLTTLAKKLNTNTKYLSETINTTKNKNFNAYINELRVNYIINKLKTEPIYRDYKIKYLAEISGFSSHSLFTVVFKNITTLSPNEFIKALNDPKHEN